MIKLAVRITVLLSVMVSLGCAPTDHNTIQKSRLNYSKICLDGVVYWSGHSRLAVKFNRDGKVALCP